MQWEIRAILGHVGEARQSLEKALVRLEALKPTKSEIFQELALDFLVAALYLLVVSGRKDEAGQILQVVQQRITPESDLAQRVQQLTLDQRDLCPFSAPPAAEADGLSLAGWLRAFRL
jgi:hypothetical protein